MLRKLRNLLKSQTLDDVNPSAFKQVAGVVYPDEHAKEDLSDFVEVVHSYQATHLPAYGHSIPRSFASGSTTMSSGSAESNKLFQVAAGEIWQVEYIAFTGVDIGYSAGDQAMLTLDGKPVTNIIPPQASAPFQYNLSIAPVCHDEQLKAYVSYPRVLLHNPTNVAIDVKVLLSWTTDDDTTIFWAYSKVSQ